MSRVCSVVDKIISRASNYDQVMPPLKGLKGHNHQRLQICFFCGLTQIRTPNSQNICLCDLGLQLCFGFNQVYDKHSRFEGSPRVPNSNFSGIKDQQNRTTEFNSPTLFQKPFSHVKSSSLDPQTNRKTLPTIDADEQQTAMILPHLMLSMHHSSGPAVTLFVQKVKRIRFFLKMKKRFPIGSGGVSSSCRNTCYIMKQCHNRKHGTFKSHSLKLLESWTCGDHGGLIRFRRAVGLLI